MPIFPHRKFTPKLPKQRELRLNSVPKLAEDIDDFRNIKLKLSGEKEFQFVDGVWISLKRNQAEAGGGGVDDVARVVRANKKLEDENAMLNVKIDIMLDLLTECVAEKDAILRKQNVI